MGKTSSRICVWGGRESKDITHQGDYDATWIVFQNSYHATTNNIFFIGHTCTTPYVSSILQQSSDACVCWLNHVISLWFQQAENEIRLLNYAISKVEFQLEQCVGVLNYWHWHIIVWRAFNVRITLAFIAYADYKCIAMWILMDHNDSGAWGIKVAFPFLYCIPLLIPSNQITAQLRVSYIMV